MSAWTVLYGGELSKDVATKLVEGALRPHVMLAPGLLAVPVNACKPHSDCKTVNNIRTDDVDPLCKEARSRIHAILIWSPTGAAGKSIALTAIDMDGFKRLKIDSKETKIIFIIQVYEILRLSTRSLAHMFSSVRMLSRLRTPCPLPALSRACPPSIVSLSLPRSRFRSLVPLSYTL